MSHEKALANPGAADTVLTSDLVRVRIVKKEVRPWYVNDRDPEILALAASLIEAFKTHEGQPRHVLEDELGEILGADTDFLLHRALAKLLFDRCDFEASAVKPAEELREALFGTAAAAYRRRLEEEEGAFSFDRRAVLTEAADALGVTVDELETGLYSDLKSEQVLARWKPCRPDWLVRRYNVALAQGVLFRATELTLEVGPANPKLHRQLFRKIKFFQLMHRVSPTEDGGWRIVLDGPVSLFKASGKYGIRMASFLPTLLHFSDWQLKADLQWGPKRRLCKFRLDSEKGLRSHTKLTGQWQPEELEWFPEQFDKLDSPWSISTDGELVNLGGEGVLVPDFVFTHAETGRRVFMEVFGFWRKGAVESRLALLRRHGPEDLVLALSTSLATGRDDLGDLPGEVYTFRTHPIARKVLKVLATFEP